MQNKNIDLIESAQHLAKRAGLGITDYFLLNRALTHRSYLNEHPDAIEDNERLEFLGDAVLDFVTASWLYNQFPEMPEGDLTRMRSALVTTEQLANFARMIDLGRAMRLGKGERQNGGHKRSQLLCDSFEAVIGALYLDRGVEEVKTFITPFLQEASDDILLNQKIEDSKSMFQEWAQAQGFPAPVYRVANEFGPEHSKEFEVEVFINGEVYGKGSGKSKQMAAKEAAGDALEKLGIE